MGGQNNSEEAAELVATIRGEHVVMKNWFMGSTKDAVELRDRYGPYPGLWKEVLNWPGWKDARKAYLRFTQGASAEEDSNKSTSAGGNNNNNNTSSSGDLPRKRRSRWGVTSNDDKSATSNRNDANNDHHQQPNKRRSRWGRDGGGPAGGGGANNNSNNHYGPAGSAPAPAALKPLPGLGLPGMPTNLPPEKQDEFRRCQSKLRDVNDKLGNLEREAARVDALPRGHRDRSPSPPPVYGADGKRKNTRAVRWRQKYSAERQDILERLMNLNPATKQSGLFRRKRSKKIRIPVEDHPQYNFIGLIIGPRGKTQKELESKTGCKIAIRGRGSVKEGARGRRDGKVMESDDEPLHVVITGDDQRSVDAATDMIEQMLVVIDDEKNVHKQQQLRELALLNGTLKEDEFCQICAEKGHRSFECPKRYSMRGKQSIQVKCAICGDTSHPTRDCTQKPDQSNNPANQKAMDSDYMSFMAELDGKKVEKANPALPPGAPKVCLPVGPTNGAGAVPPPGPPPPPKSDLPFPPPPGLPRGGAPRPMTGLPPPPPPGAAAGGLPPPPPPQAAPPHAYNNNATNNNYYGNQQHYQNYQQPPHQQQQNHPQQQQHGVGNYYGQQPQQQQQPNHYGNQPQQNQQQQWQQQQEQWQQQQQQQGGQGWDYRSYYGSGGQGGDAGGAGGFNWWEN